MMTGTEKIKTYTCNIDLLKINNEMVFHAFIECDTTFHFQPSVLKTFTVNAKLTESLILTID